MLMQYLDLKSYAVLIHLCLMQYLDLYIRDNIYTPLSEAVCRSVYLTHYLYLSDAVFISVYPVQYFYLSDAVFRFVYIRQYLYIYV